MSVRPVLLLCLGCILCCSAAQAQPVCSGFVGFTYISPMRPGPSDVIGYTVVISPDLEATITPRTRFFSSATIGTTSPFGATAIDIDVIVGSDSMTLPGYHVAGSYYDDFLGYVGPLPVGTYMLNAVVRVPDPVNGGFVPFCAVTGGGTIHGVFASAAPVVTAPVIEYYDAKLDHYFITQDAGEIHALDTGAFPGWVRTGQSFMAYLPGQSDGRGRPVTRYYGLPSKGLDSHFLSTSVTENRAMVFTPLLSAAWVVEGNDVFEIATPETLSGACPAATIPVYRLWNNRSDSDHRYTTDPAIKAQMVAAGYIAEGYGPDSVIMCAIAQ